MAKDTQPAIINAPPIGTIAPRILGAPSTIAYKHPEKITGPSNRQYTGSQKRRLGAVDLGFPSTATPRDVATELRHSFE